MPRFAGLGLLECVTVRCHTLPRPRPFSRVQFAPDVGVLRLIGSNVGDLGYIAMGAVDLLFVALKCLHHVAHGTRPEESREEGNLPHTPTWARVGRHLLTQAQELRLPDGGMPALAGGDALKGTAPCWVFLNLGKGVVQEDCVSL